MDTIYLKKYQAKLSRRREQIVATVRRLEKESQELAGQRHLDWLDQAWDENEIRLLERLDEAYLHELEKIETALGRISAGTYGRCMACHEPIERARLDIFPATEFCRACQEMRERFEKAA